MSDHPSKKEKIASLLSAASRRILPLIFIAGSIGIFMMLLFIRAEVKTTAPTERVWNITAERVQLDDFDPILNVFGEIVAGRRVELRALVAGEIIETASNLRDGGIIEAGDDLLKIDPFIYETAVEEAAARLTEARARLEELLAQRIQEKNLLARAEEQAQLRNRDLDRARKLAKDGHISQKTLDDKKLAVSQQRQSVEMRKSSLAIQEARLQQQEGAVTRSEIALTLADRDLARTVLQSPFRGFLNNVAAGEGRHVNINDRIATLTDADQLEVRFHLSDQQFGRIVTSAGSLKGQEININWRVGKKTLPFQGQIIRIGAEISQRAGGVSVFASIQAPNIDSTLRPGAFVEVHLPDKTYKNVALLPEDVLYHGDIVYVIVKGRLEPRAVKTAGNIGGDIIIESGLKNGDVVMTTWFAEAGPGTRVNILESAQKTSAQQEQK